ncbi:MAG: NADH-quinone oxidoreductase subunit NuoE [Bacillota bacterium]
MSTVAPLLSKGALDQIEREAAKYPPEQRQSAVMSALRIAQEEHGSLSNELMEEVAKVLRMAPVHVYEVATFYNMYNLKPVGRHKVVLCTNLPCALSGALDAAEHLKARLGVEFNETSADGCVTLKEGECFGTCGDAPVLVVDNKRVCSFMSNEKLDQLIEELKR